MCVFVCECVWVGVSHKAEWGILVRQPTPPIFDGTAAQMEQVDMHSEGLRPLPSGDRIANQYCIMFPPCP